MKTLTKNKGIIAAIIIGLFISSCKKEVATSTDVTFSGTLSSLSDTTDANVQYLNASADAGSTALYVDGVIKGPGYIPYSSATGYYIEPDKVARQTIDVKTSSGSILASTSSGFVSAKYYTIYLTGQKMSSNLSIFISTDEQPTPPSLGNVKVKFVNAAENTSILDINANGTMLFGGQGYTGTTFYKELPAGKYTFTMNVHGSTTMSVTMSSITLASGKIYTVFAKNNIQGGKVVLDGGIFANN